MHEIRKRPSRDLRNNYPEVAEIVMAHNNVIITNKGKADFVLISPEEFEKFKAFQHRKYVLDALREAEENLEKNRDNPNYLIEEDDFWARFEE